MMHNDAVRVFGQCECPCHRGGGPCWCRGRERDPYEIAHNDRVRHFGGCDCRGRVCDRRTTSAELRRALDEHDHHQRDLRIRSGRMRASDISYAAQHPHRYPHLFR